MDSPSSLTPPATLLPLHTVLGGWRVVAWAGCGVHGTVYRAVPADDELASPVALKLALHPDDPRFAREAELLARCLHPSIPRLLDQGSWLSPAGTRHPFLVLQWVEGVPLMISPGSTRPRPRSCGVGCSSWHRRWRHSMPKAPSIAT